MENKYLRHLTPSSDPSWGRKLASDLVSVCQDPDLPPEFRDELRGELLEIKDELKRIKIENEKEEW